MIKYIDLLEKCYVIFTLPAAERRYCNRYFWRSYDSQEVDLIEEAEEKFTVYEFKYNLNQRAKLPRMAEIREVCKGKVKSGKCPTLNKP